MPRLVLEDLKFQLKDIVYIVGNIIADPKVVTHIKYGLDELVEYCVFCPMKEKYMWYPEAMLSKEFKLPEGFGYDAEADGGEMPNE
jgi:hypothetical protein